LGHRFGALWGPDHASLLESGADDSLTGAFHRTTADVLASLL
jgi:hypothetical protein